MANWEINTPISLSFYVQNIFSSVRSLHMLEDLRALDIKICHCGLSCLQVTKPVLSANFNDCGQFLICACNWLIPSFQSWSWTTLDDIQNTLAVFFSRAQNSSTQQRRQQPRDPSMEMVLSFKLVCLLGNHMSVSLIHWKWTQPRELLC